MRSLRCLPFAFAPVFVFVSALEKPELHKRFLHTAEAADRGAERAACTLLADEKYCAPAHPHPAFLWPSATPSESQAGSSFITVSIMMLIIGTASTMISTLPASSILEAIDSCPASRTICAPNSAIYEMPMILNTVLM